MRTTTTLMIGLISATPVLRAQAPGDSLYMFFDDASDNLQLDSVYPAGCWQVGTPSKPVFTSAYSPGRALVTDTLLPYPDSTTCYAEFTLIATDFNFTGRSVLFKQWRDMDPTSSGTIEVMNPWDSQWRPYGTDSFEDLIVDQVWQQDNGNGYFFTGQSAGWEEVWLESPCMGVFMHEDEQGARWYDPIMRVRLVFNSGNNANGHDGWMIDNVRGGVSLCSGGVGEHVAPVVSIAPNPAVDQLLVTVGGPPATSSRFDIFASDGSLATTVYSSSGTATIDVTGLSNGLYTLRVTGDGLTSVKPFVVQR
ncbi:MAG: T9SS type A sorting domain-containing protein [Flavobacteriales bacterium]|nr:T9SS type A sorting domain-containing protein [Flavobacteriales bacterium]